MTGRTFRRLLLASLIIALSASGISYLMNRWFKTETGLRCSFYPGTSAKAEPRLVKTSESIDLKFLRDVPLSSPFSVQWEGFWPVRDSGVYQFSVSADDFVALWIDRSLVAEARVKMLQPVFALYPARPGIHEIKIVYKQYAGAFDVAVHAAKAGSRLKPVDTGSFFPVKPEESQVKVNRTLLLAQRLSRLLWIVPAALFLLAAGSRILSYCRPRASRLFTPAIRKAVWIAVPCLILLYGSALRFEAVLSRFWPIQGSSRFVTVQVQLAEVIRHLRPEPYWDKETRPYAKGDPGGYLRFAREMKNFYAGHVREPLFVFVTKVFLQILNQQDIAVSFASAFFSALTILATYLLGAAVGSRPAGALASLAVAVEREVIRCGTAGLRDDAFMFFTVLFAYACVRLYRDSSLANVILAGFVGGGACLVRITALSFVLPSYCFLLLVCRPWRKRLAPVAASAVLAGAVLAPYLISCALTYGDPLYAINDTTKFYRAREHIEAGKSMSVGEYLKMKMSIRPYQFLKTGLVGMTGYPFNNKWNGFDYWDPLLGRLLYWAAILGLFLLLFSPEGRVILVVLFASILPFAFTWDVKGGAEYRFTIHAYPFYLVASCYALVRVAGLLNPSRMKAISADLAAHKRRVALQAGIGLAAGLLVLMGYRSLLIKQVEESLEAGESVTVPADGSLFFGKGWDGAVQVREERFRISEGPESELRLPLAAGSDYTLSLSVDPLILPPAEGRQMSVILNRSAIGIIQLEKDRSVYGISLPGTSVRQGINEIGLLTPDPFAFSSAVISKNR